LSIVFEVVPEKQSSEELEAARTAKAAKLGDAADACYTPQTRRAL